MYQILAQASEPVPGQSEPPAFFKLITSQFFLIAMLVVVFYIFVIRANKTKEKQRKNMLNEMKKGDRVQTIGGILAGVVEVREDRVLLKVDETSNTKIWFARSAVHKVLGEEKSVEVTK